MQAPINAPFVRDATFISGVGPSIGARWLNVGVQDALADLYGAVLGRSATIRVDDFVDLDMPAGHLGQLRIITNTNLPGTMRVANVAGAAAGQHGIAQVLATAAAAWDFLAEDGRSHLGTFDFLFSAKAAVVDLGNLDTYANRGLQLGLFDTNEAAGTSCRFIAGNDEANWQVLVGATKVDTLIPVVDGQYYDLQMARLGTSVTAYIDGALVATVAHNVSMPTARRRVGTKGNGAIGDGLLLDYFKAWMQR